MTMLPLSAAVPANKPAGRGDDPQAAADDMFSVLMAGLVGVPGVPVAQPIGPDGAIRLRLTAHDDDVILDNAAWERLTPAANRPEDTSYQSERGMGDAVKTWFGDPHLKAGETRLSTAISLPSDRPCIFKIAATDRAGHRLAAWIARDAR